MVKRGTLTVCRIIYLVYGIGVLRSQGEHVHLDNIVDIREVPAVFPVPVDNRAFVVHQFLYKQGYHGRICAERVLAATKHVKVAKTYALHAVCPCEHIRIQLVHIFGDCIRGKRLAYNLFRFGQGLAVAIGGRTGRIDKPLYFGVTGCQQHVKKSVNVHGIGRYRILNGAGDRTQSSLMQHILHPFNRLFAVR